MNDDGILVLGHGTRDPRGTALFLQLEEMVGRKVKFCPVAVGFMEFAAPTAVDAAEKLVAAGAKRIVVAPVFLSSVGHMSEDVPQAIREASERVSPTPIVAAPYVGGSRKVAELSEKRFNEAIAAGPNVPLEDTLLILAAHGSPEPEAFDEFAAFVRRRSEWTPLGRVEACFSMMGAPRLADVLEEAAVGPFRRVVVQPHFILPGRLSEMVRAEAEKMRRLHPDKEWIASEPLGIEELLADAIVEVVNSFVP